MLKAAINGAGKAGDRSPLVDAGFDLELVEPTGIRQLTMGKTTTDPYSP